GVHIYAKSPSQKLAKDFFPLWMFCFLFQDSINNTVFHRFLRTHPVVAIKILHDLLERLPAVVGQDPGTQFLGLDDLLGLYLNVRGLPPCTTARLMDHHARMGLDEPSPLFAHGQKNGSHGSRKSTANGGNRALDLLDGIVN